MGVSDRRQRDRTARERAIIKAARDLAEAEGWEAVTTRRLSEAIEYSQPVLYGHFPNGKAGIVDAVALDGFAKLGVAVRKGRRGTRTTRTRITRLIEDYLDFAEAHPAVYGAMFSGPTGLAFGQADSPEPLRVAFCEIVECVAPAAETGDHETYAEVVWSAMHGLATLSRDGRLRPSAKQRRIKLLVDVLLR